MYFCHEATAPTQIVKPLVPPGYDGISRDWKLPLSTGVEISYSNCSQSLADRHYGWGGGEVANLISRPPTVQLGL